MKKIKYIFALALFSLMVVMAVACTKSNSLKENDQDKDTQVEKPIEDEKSDQDDENKQEQETPVTVETNETSDTDDAIDEQNEDETLDKTDPKKIIEATSEQVIGALSSKDMAVLSEFIHPVKGVRFTPYTYVSLENDLIYTKEEILGFFDDTDQYLWGYYDGTGDEIKLTPSEYYDSFVYSEDFKNAPEIGYNEVLSFGNALENQFEVYESPIVVEYYFPGFDEQYEGMDWRSLRLVYEQHEDSWKLVGIIHNQWTI